MRFPEFTVVELLAPATDAAGRDTTIYASLKNVHRAWIVFHVTQGNAATILVSPKQATSVAGGGAKVLTNNAPLWAAEDLATSDILEPQTAAKNFTTSAAVKHKMVMFQIEPAALDVEGGFDCIGVTTGASNAGNLTSAVLIAELRYGSDEPVSLIAD